MVNVGLDALLEDLTIRLLLEKGVVAAFHEAGIFLPVFTAYNGACGGPDDLCRSPLAHQEQRALPCENGWLS